MEETRIQVVKADQPFGTIASLKDILEIKKEDITKSLNKIIDSEFFIKSIITTVAKQPEILECTSASVITAISECAALGLVPGSQRLVALIPFKNKKNDWKKELQMIPEYRGLIALAYRTGLVSSFDAEPKYKNDEFECEQGSAPFLKHRPKLPRLLDAAEQAEFYYAICRFKNGDCKFVTMDLDEIDAVRDRKEKVSPMWNSDYNEMAKKTCIRRLAKTLYLSPDFSFAVTKEDSILFDENLITEPKNLKIGETSKPELS